MSHKTELLSVHLTGGTREKVAENRRAIDELALHFAHTEEQFWTVVELEDEVRDRKGWITENDFPTISDRVRAARAIAFYESRSQLFGKQYVFKNEGIPWLEGRIIRAARIIDNYTWVNETWDQYNLDRLRLNLLKGMALLQAARAVLARVELLLADSEGLAKRCQQLLDAEFESALRSSSMPAVLTEFHKVVPTTKVVHG